MEDNNTLKTYICNTCNTIFSINSSDDISCIYCNSKEVEEHDLDLFDDYSIIPFNYLIDNAKKKYKSMIRFNFLLPFTFRKKRIIKNIKKIYLPCYLYDANISGKVKFIGADRIMKSQEYEILHDINIDCSNILVSAYDKVDDSVVSSINDYNFEELNNYNDIEIDNSIISINIDEKDTRDNINNKINNMALNVVKGNIKHDLKRLDTNDTIVDFSSIKKILIPIYYLNIKYKDKDYNYYMNGNTGKSILDTTSSRISMILLFIVLFIIFLLISIIISILI